MAKVRLRVRFEVVQGNAPIRKTIAIVNKNSSNNYQVIFLFQKYKKWALTWSSLVPVCCFFFVLLVFLCAVFAFSFFFVILQRFFFSSPLFVVSLFFVSLLRILVLLPWLFLFLFGFAYLLRLNSIFIRN